MANDVGHLVLPVSLQNAAHLIDFIHLTIQLIFIGHYSALGPMQGTGIYTDK